MKLNIKDPTNKDAGSISLPLQFDEEYRPDLIQRAVLSLQARARTPYGAKPTAGKRASAELSRRRRKYRGSYGMGISRVPRKILTRRGTRMHWVGAFAPGTVGGRRAHPPKADKIWTQKINKTENRKAIRSALAATVNRDLVVARGHRTPKDYPFIISTDFETITKTRDAITAFSALSLGEELARADQKKVRAGKGKVRGRKYKRRIGPLVVVSSTNTKIALAARNIPGVDIVCVAELNAEVLAPGTHAGRITLYTEAAIKLLAEEKLFTQSYKAPAKATKQKVAKPKVTKTPTKSTSKPKPSEKPPQTPVTKPTKPIKKSAKPATKVEVAA